MSRRSGGQCVPKQPLPAVTLRWRAGILVLTACLLLFAAQPVRSQSQARLVAYGLSTLAFPTLQLSFEAYDSQGNFIEDLAAGDVIVEEDGQAVGNLTLAEVEPGLQFTIALTPGTQLNTRFGDRTQLDFIRTALEEWAMRQPESGKDRYSFSTNTGLQVILSNNPLELATALAGYQPNMQTEVNIFSLTTAVDLVADQTAEPRVKRAILWITPPVAPSLAPSLQDLASRAQQAGVRIFAWVAVNSLDNAVPDTSALQNLTDTTGGRLTLIAGRETLPDLESWVAPLRKTYTLNFVSTVRQSGAHIITIGLAREGFAGISQRLDYTLEIKPPNPIFLSPPTRLERMWSDPADGEESVLLPDSHPLQVLIEFPDGYPRALQTARLYQDGALVVERSAPPFDVLEWDLSGLTESGVHTMRIEVVDSLGLSASSIDTPIEIIVANPPVTNLLQRVSSRGLVAVAAVLVAGLVLGLIVFGENRLRGRRRQAEKRRREDPVTQPVSIAQDVPRNRRAASERGSLPKTATSPGIPARLIRVTDDEQPVPGSLIPLNRSELTLGSDARQAMVLVEDASVNKVHARLVRNGESGFTLLDEGSVAGTWVNFTPLPPEGKQLAHDDLIHIGRVTFRFELTKPPALRQPVVESLEQADESA